MDDTFERALATSRMMPAVTDLNRHFWTGGANGQLLLLRCEDCQRWVNPPQSACPSCSGTLSPQPTSGKGTVFTYTVTHQPYNPAAPVPYVVAIVELGDQEGLRVFTNLIGIAPASVTIGMPVEVCFEDHGEVFVPLFTPSAP